MLPANSLIHTKTGIKKLEDVKIGDKVLTSSGYREVKNFFIQGKQHLSTIYTGCGEFKCSPDHLIAVVNNITEYKWVEAKYLQEGDILLTTRRPIEGDITYLPKNEFCFSNKPIIELTPTIAWFIGLFNEAGNYNTDNISDSTFVPDLTSFNITVYNKDCIDSIKSIIKIFDNDAVCTVKRLYDENIYTIVCKKEHLSYYFNKYFKKFDDCDEVPIFIKNSTIDIRMAYITGVIDGNIENYDNGFVITWSNKKRVDELQSLCYSCGLETTNIVVNSRCFNMSNVLKITTYFTANVLNNISQLHMNINIDDIYNGKCSFPVKMVKDFIEDEYEGYESAECTRLCNKLDMDNSEKININDFDNHVLTLNYCPTVVTKVVYDNSYMENSYDIEVDDKHEFYCDGYLIHNTL